MADYKSQNITGQSWQRCCRVEISNPKGGIPQVNFVEEKIVDTGSGYITQPIVNLLDLCSATFSATGEFPLVDTETLLPTGQTMTHGQLYQALFSLYMDTATKRDAQS